MKMNTWISGFYPAMNDRFVVVVGGDADMVERFNKGDFGPYEKAVKGFEKKSFQLEVSPIEMY